MMKGENKKELKAKKPVVMTGFYRVQLVYTLRPRTNHF